MGNTSSINGTIKFCTKKNTDENIGKKKKKMTKEERMLLMEEKKLKREVSDSLKEIFCLYFVFAFV